MTARQYVLNATDRVGFPCHCRLSKSATTVVRMEKLIHMKTALPVLGQDGTDLLKGFMGMSFRMEKLIHMKTAWHVYWMELTYRKASLSIGCS